jgi:hypothetical protein
MPTAAIGGRSVRVHSLTQVRLPGVVVDRKGDFSKPFQAGANTRGLCTNNVLDGIAVRPGDYSAPRVGFHWPDKLPQVEGRFRSDWPHDAELKWSR